LTGDFFKVRGSIFRSSLQEAEYGIGALLTLFLWGVVHADPLHEDHLQGRALVKGLGEPGEVLVAPDTEDREAQEGMEVREVVEVVVVQNQFLVIKAKANAFIYSHIPRVPILPLVLVLPLALPCPVLLLAQRYQ
jgi:hypothetical protein